LIDRAGLPVSQDDCLADQLLFGSMQFAEDSHGSLVAVSRREQVKNLREGAKLMAPGLDRETLLRKARQTETAAHI